MIGQTIGEAIAGGIQGTLREAARNRRIESLRRLPGYEDASRDHLTELDMTLNAIDYRSGDEAGTAFERLLDDPLSATNLETLRDFYEDLGRPEVREFVDSASADEARDFYEEVATREGELIARFQGLEPIPLVYRPGIDRVESVQIGEGTAPTRSYGRRIRSGRDLERAEAQYLRNHGERVIRGEGIDRRRVRASYEGDNYPLGGREYDVVSVEDGFYTLTETKFRRTKRDVELNLRVRGIWDDAPPLIWQGVQIATTIQQGVFDFNARDNLTLTGRSIPGGSVTLDSDRYQIVWVVGNQYGRGLAASTTDARRVQQILDIVSGEQDMRR